MTRAEAIEIIEQEELKNYNINEDRYNREYEVIIKYLEKENKWIVYATDERASLWGREFYTYDESEAWDNFIKKLRVCSEFSRK
ncbi:MAG: Imm59 family immunity protein [Culicoidibacterales bacterium]